MHWVAKMAFAGVKEATRREGTGGAESAPIRYIHG